MKFKPDSIFMSVIDSPTTDFNGMVSKIKNTKETKIRINFSLTGFRDLDNCYPDFWMPRCMIAGLAHKPFPANLEIRLVSLHTFMKVLRKPTLKKSRPFKLPLMSLVCSGSPWKMAKLILSGQISQSSLKASIHRCNLDTTTDQHWNSIASHWFKGLTSPVEALILLPGTDTFTQTNDPQDNINQS
jgi:hypothetical protein